MAHLSCTFKSGPLVTSRSASRLGLRVSKPQPLVCMAKKGLHPEWHDEAKVFCNGEEVLVTSGTKGSYTVDIWSGNHPYYQGAATTVVTDEGSVNRFKRRYAGLASLAAVETVSSKAAAAKKQ